MTRTIAADCCTPACMHLWSYSPVAHVYPLRATFRVSLLANNGQYLHGPRRNFWPCTTGTL